MQLPLSHPCSTALLLCSCKHLAQSHELTNLDLIGIIFLWSVLWALCGAGRHLFTVSRGRDRKLEINLACQKTTKAWFKSKQGPEQGWETFLRSYSWSWAKFHLSIKSWLAEHCSIKSLWNDKEKWLVSVFISVGERNQASLEKPSSTWKGSFSID